MSKQKGLLVFIYRWGHDTTGDGVTSKVDSIILVDDKIEGPFDVEDDVPYLSLVRRNLFGGEYIHAIPMLNGKPITGGNQMDGGNFIYSCDSRFRAVNKYPIPVHDRFEKW